MIDEHALQIERAGHPGDGPHLCLLLRYEQTSASRKLMSPNDPKRTFPNGIPAGTQPVGVIKLLLADCGAVKCDGENFWAFWA
jgi:hypothetical protein